ncbi:MAG TPA: N,N-dimethylformamidase beta subunit family domain-containing protein [Gemmataceae bacterium]|nr:N,N-dimethylformamidase beta subunit family domain-containing protein [Gemmataceae bacterium]
MTELNRREALAAMAAAGTGGFTPAARRSDLVRTENDCDGTTDWQLTYVKLDARAKYRQPLIEGYCTKMSVVAGEKLGFCVSTDPASAFTIDLYRLGYYRGAGGRHVAQLGPFEGQPQPVPPVGEMRLRECHWEPCTTIEIPKDWPSGVYLGKLSAARHRYQSYVIFIVRDSRPADVLFQCSTNTWQAYNKWPDTYSLYDNDRPDKKPLVPGVRVSFDRPFARYPQVTDNPLSLGSGEFLLFEFPFAFWLEQHGYDVTYCTNEDVHQSLDTLTRCKAFLSVGHDEYWSRPQFDHCLEAVKRGVNFGFFSGNACCFVTPFSPSSGGAANRVIERKGRYGGMRPEEEKWMAELESAPNENTLIGARTVIPFNGSGDWVCAKPKHWVFAGTGMKKGEKIPGLVGWEHHGDPADIPGLEIVAAGKTWTGGEQESHYEATIYPGPKGNTVFNAATIFWAQGLSSPPGHWLPYVHNGRPHGPDKRIHRITNNLLSRWVGS